MSKDTKTYIKIENWGEMELDYLLNTIKQLKGKGNWNFNKWKPTAALVDKNGRTSTKYVGQQFDSNHIDLVPDGWDHDHCEICTKTISNRENQDDWVTEGYNHNESWICEECYNLFMKPTDLQKEFNKYVRLVK